MNQPIDYRLITKYDQAGPRYTSYPTAPMFHESVAADVLVEHFARHPRPETPLSLYLHLPFCHQLCWYCGCNMLVSRNRDKINHHVGLLQREVDFIRPNIHKDRQTAQIHLGGGTPNYIGNENLTALMKHLRDQFPVTADAEISIELDPRHTNAQTTENLKACGFNRVSLGVQDFNAEVQAAIHREQPYELVKALVEDLRQGDLNAINMDLIYGLPNQTRAGFSDTVDKVIGLEPSRIALFNFAYVPQMKPHMKLIKREALPEPETKFRILEDTVNRLVAAGYVFIGMDHFAHPSDPLAKAALNGDLHRNFQGYTTCAETEMLAFGMSAISMFDDLYVQNHSKLADYEERVANDSLATWRGYRLIEDDRNRRAIINQFMCQKRIDIAHCEALIGCEFEAALPGVLDQLIDMAEDGLLIQRSFGFEATQLGQLLMRNVAMLFDRYLPEMIARRKAHFSRTV